jgi:hypothetical protein
LARKTNGKTMMQEEPVISAVTHAHKRISGILIVLIVLAMCVSTPLLFIYAPTGRPPFVDVPYFLMLMLGVVLVIHWGTEVIGYQQTQIEVFRTFIRLTMGMRHTDLKLADITSITQREGLFRDEIILQTQKTSFWLENLDKSFRVYDAIQDVAINSDDDQIRHARFMVKRSTGLITWNESIGMKGKEEIPLMAAKSTFLRFTLSSPATTYILSLALALAMIWAIANNTPWPFLFDLSAAGICVALVCFLILSAAYTFFVERTLNVYPDRIVVTSVLDELVVHKEDIQRCLIRRHFLLVFIFIQMKDGKIINLRGFQHANAIIDAINWSEDVTTREQRSLAVKQEGKESPPPEQKPSAISLKKSDD